MATASDFNQGQSIQSKSNLKHRGTVIGNKLSDGDQVVAVEWEDGALSKANVNDIQVCLSIEEEFKNFQDEINAKLQQAADLVREAADLAAGRNLDLLSNDEENYERLFDIDTLEGAMEQGGWNTSSWYC